jgi:hypothetical protein
MARIICNQTYNKTIFDIFLPEDLLNFKFGTIDSITIIKAITKDIQDTPQNTKKAIIIHIIIFKFEYGINAEIFSS